MLHGHQQLSPNCEALPWSLGEVLPAGKLAAMRRALCLKFGGELEESRNSCLSRAQVGNGLPNGLSGGAEGEKQSSQHQVWASHPHRSRHTCARLRFCSVSICCCTFQVTRRTRSHCAQLRNGYY